MRDPRLPPSPSPNDDPSGFDSRIRDTSRRYPSNPASAAASSSNSWNHHSSPTSSSILPPAHHFHHDFAPSQPGPHHVEAAPYSQNPRSARAPYHGAQSSDTASPSRQQTFQAPVHRVYVLNCATCDTFLTNRGMRAVLLLKPHIVLFSTDAPPCNAETSWPDDSVEEEHVERTCDCLTSSIACHGCGRVVGYHIVAPCSKCTESVQKHQRSANHHRFVFHHNEVVSKERTYYSGERGVNNPVIIVSIYDVEKDLIESRLAPPINPAATYRPSHEPRHSPRSPSPPVAQVVTLLKPGDVLYWHHLVNGGERTKPVDPTTREPVWTESIGR
ncbi:hypothetical protein JCM3766R1_001377 [Sporobolomyces carnicolor]